MGKRNIGAIEGILHKELIKTGNIIPGTEAVYKGNDPEEGGIVYYFLIPGNYNPDISDLITNADITLSRKFPNLNFSLSRWPIPASQASKYPFLGRRIHPKL